MRNFVLGMLVMNMYLGVCVMVNGGLDVMIVVCGVMLYV